MNIFHISAECYPIAKVGGLGDVVGALPKYQNKLGETSSVIMPFYNNKFTTSNKFKKVFSGRFNLGITFDFDILTLQENTLGYELYLVHIPGLLYTEYVYSSNDTERFLGFQIALLDWVVQLKQQPDIVHCHDHHTGLIPFMMSQSYAYHKLRTTPTVVTIHNGQYQGWFSHNKIHLIPPFDFSKAGLLDWKHLINPLASAIKCAWKVTTVSPNYMEELKHAANGLEDLLRYESGKCVGILNGIDDKVWDPATDDSLIKNYTLKTVTAGKKANKEWLCKEFNLNPELPLFAFIGRLVGEKGADLLPDIFGNSLVHKNLSIMMLGSGDSSVEHQLDQLKYRYPGYYNTYIGYNERLAHIVYAAADFLVMPSRVEPCGLNQMYALRYGTVPIVDKVGGLKDTVQDFDDNGFGILHDGATVHEGSFAIHRAINFYNDTDRFKKNRNLIMKIDHSWDSSAQAYINLYNSLIL
ncbi:glycogen synthase [Gelidibacter mesophilus]|uniref:glycogen synthase n=1 Tax=Gelidibacter mesophilus TaxID=169050 RepID=UPI000409BFCC|nr:glycogen/starch synthase [Gelidibacter mesophilus]